MTTESEPTAIADALAVALSKLKTTADERAVEERSGVNRMKIDMFIEQAKAQWNVPKRHLAAPVRADGQWEKTRAGLSAKLGTGFLFGLVSGRGTGKTQLAVELIKETVLTRHKNALFCNAMDFFIAVKESYRDGSESDERSVIRRYTAPALLVIDEIARRGESEWENNLLFHMVNKRYEDMKDTLLICNQSVADFEKSIGDSLISRLRETGGVIQCTWPSFRQ